MPFTPIQDLETKWFSYLKDPAQCPKVLGLAPVSKAELEEFSTCFRAKVGNSHVNVLTDRLKDYPAIGALWLTAMAARAYEQGNFWETFADATGYSLPVHHHEQLWRAFRATKRDDTRRYSDFFHYQLGPMKPAQWREEFLFQAAIAHVHCPSLVCNLKNIEQQLGFPDSADSTSASWLQEQILQRIDQSGTLQTALKNQNIGLAICEGLMRFIHNEHPINLPEALVHELTAAFARDAEGKPKTIRQGQTRTHQLRPKELAQERLFLAVPRLVYTSHGPQFECKLDFNGADFDLPPGADAQLICGSTKLCNLARQNDGSWRRADLLTGIKLTGPAEAEIEVVYGPDKTVAARQAVVLWHSGSLVSRYGGDGELHTDPTRRQLPVGSAFSLVAHPQATVTPQPSSEHQLAGGWKVWHFNQGWAGAIDVTLPGDAEPWWSSAWVESIPTVVPEAVKYAQSTSNWWLSLEQVNAAGVHARLCWSSDLEFTALRVGNHVLTRDKTFKRSTELIPLTDEALWHGAPLSAKVTSDGRAWRIVTSARVYMRDEPIALLRDNDGRIKRLHAGLSLSARELRFSRLLLLRRREGGEEAVPLQQADLKVGELDHFQGSLKEVLARGAALKTEIAGNTYTLTDGIEDCGLLEDVQQLEADTAGIRRLLLNFAKPRAVSERDTLVLAVQATAPRIRMVAVDLSNVEVSSDQRSWTICAPVAGATLLGVAMAHDSAICGTWLLNEHNRSWAYPITLDNPTDEEVKLVSAFCKLFHAPVLRADVIDDVVAFYARNAALVFSQWAGLAELPQVLTGLKSPDQRWPGVVAQLSLRAARWAQYQDGVANWALPVPDDPWLLVDLATYSPWIATRLLERLAILPKLREQLLLAVRMPLANWPQTNGIDALAATQRLAATANVTTDPVPPVLLPHIKQHLWSGDFAKLVLVKMLNPNFQFQ